MTTIDRKKVEALQRRKAKRFVEEHPQSAALYERAQNSLLGGVPMNWMKKWAGAFPVFVKSAKGAHFTCVDGHDYVDLCLGDTAAMIGPSPEAVVKAVAERARKGITLMLPTEDALHVGEDLKKRFGLPVLAIHVDGDGREPIFDPDCARDYPAGEDSWYFITAITARWTKHLRVCRMEL